MPAYSLENTVKELKADAAAIMMPNLADGYLYCYDSFNMPQSWIDIQNPLDEMPPSLNTQVYKSGEPAISNDIRMMLAGYPLESAMVVPILRGDYVIATLEFIHNQSDKTFNDDDLRIAEEFARSINIT